MSLVKKIFFLFTLSILVCFELLESNIIKNEVSSIRIMELNVEKFQYAYIGTHVLIISDKNEKMLIPIKEVDKKALQYSMATKKPLYIKETVYYLFTKKHKYEFSY